MARLDVVLDRLGTNLAHPGVGCRRLGGGRVLGGLAKALLAGDRLGGGHRLLGPGLLLGGGRRMQEGLRVGGGSLLESLDGDRGAPRIVRKRCGRIWLGLGLGPAVLAGGWRCPLDRGSHGPQRLALLPGDLGRVRTPPPLELQVLADGVVELSHRGLSLLRAYGLVLACPLGAV